MTSVSSPAQDAAVEAARYALLRRLAPSMRHHLVVNLQPIGMVYEIMDRRLRASEPNLADVHDSAQKINSYAKAALASCLDVVTWLAPDESATTTASEGVRECLALVGTSFTFRGFTLRNEVGEVPGDVQRGAFRNVVTGALVHLSDSRDPPAEIAVTAQAGPEGLEVILAIRDGKGEPGFATAPAYRPLAWADVEALARADGVQLQRDGTTLRLTLPWMQA
jgi:C4-dicarboxylate-specific signal transduction histidine kinase